MSVEKILEQLKNLDEQEQREFLHGIQDLIKSEYVEKSNLMELQKEINDLLKENNLVRQQISSKFSCKEHQTIAYQLGKNLIEILTGKKSIAHFPSISLKLCLEAIARKDKDELTNFQKKASVLLDFQSALQHKDLKAAAAAILDTLSAKLITKEKGSHVEGAFREINNNLLNGGKQVLFDATTLPRDNATTVTAQQVFKHAIHTELKRTAKHASDLKIACIMDEFTFFCFSPEATLLQLSPENWLEEVNAFKPDLLFIESAWQGKESLWKSKVSQNSVETVSLIKFCKMNSIKTMFWNKEDPVHFGTFIDVAKQVDVVFTTDIDCIGRYKAYVGHDKVYLMPFAAQPKTHNPIEKYQRKDAFNFAGSFYLKYPERQRDFVNLTDVATKFRDLEIYDRNYNKPHPHYTFPEQYQRYILGRLEPHEIDKAYKGYIYGINMNTIKQSQSMFARRVFEMLASNTIVLSNYSRGVRNFFGDLVLCSDNPIELQNKLSKIVHDKDTLDKFRLQGLRKVLSEHTYEDRLNYILEKLNIDNTLEKVNQGVIARVNTIQEFESIISSYEIQSYEQKNLFIYNPNQLILENKAKVFITSDLQELEKNIEKCGITHIGFFATENVYTQDYLFDMMLSFKYLKYTEINCVTKDAYYRIDHELTLKDGQEYQLVDVAKLDRSIFILHDLNQIMALTSHYLDQQDCEYQCHSMSIDRFSFIEHGHQAASDVIATVNPCLSHLDNGVELLDKLLPYAESITAMSPDTDQIQSFAYEYLVNNVSTAYKTIQIESIDECFKICSKLAKSEHKYVALLKQIEQKTGEISVLLDVEGNLNSQGAIEFYDNNQVKIASEIFAINKMHRTNIPAQTEYFNLSLRLKGEGEIHLKQIDYIVHATKKVKLNDESLVYLNADVFEKYLVKGSSKQIQFARNGQQFLIKTTLAPTKHAYMYLSHVYTREELNLFLNSEFELLADSTAEDVKIVFEFQDDQHQKISHSMNSIVGGHALAIPMECKYVRIGLKIVGKGITSIDKLSLGIVKNPINNFIPKSDVLVVAKQYPSYSDLYKYGFLHSRVKTYKEANTLVDMFKLSTEAKNSGFSEFEGVDVLTHNHDMLDKLLASGIYKKICIHLIDNKIWEVVKKYQDTVQVLIWVHGAEIRSWSRRSYEKQRLGEVESNRQHKLSLQRKVFWNNLVNNELSQNTQLIFVSNYFLNECEKDLGINFPKHQTHVIHNFIDNTLFNYVPKESKQRFKVLSIRPYANLGYANDLTVEAILDLSKNPQFNKFEFTLCGDGELFEETVQPLRAFKNINLRQGFLSQSEISELHKEHGVFLVPTRVDSQGVSRDEAMSSGLVVITNKVAAIPEFVDEESGLLVESEDAIGMANALLKISNSIKLFKKLSSNAAARVRKQSGYAQTLSKELELLN